MKIHIDFVNCRIENADMKKNLADWLYFNKITRSQFAGMVGCSPATVTRILNGLMLPSLELALKIEEVTSGWMKCSDWIPAAEGVSAG